MFMRVCVCMCVCVHLNPVSSWYFINTYIPLLRSESGVAACSHSFHSPRLFFLLLGPIWSNSGLFFQNLVKWTQNVGEDTYTFKDMNAYTRTYTRTHT